MTNWRGVPSEISQAQTLAIVEILADHNGEVRDVAHEIAAQVVRSHHSIHNDMTRLAVRGELMRIAPGHYRLPNVIVRKPEREEYPTARACGIEPVTILRTYVTESSVRQFAVTLARVPSLEKPLPE